VARRMAARPIMEIEFGNPPEVPQVQRPAEAGDRARRAARRPVGQGRLPRPRDRRDALLLVARQAAGGGREQLAGKEERQDALSQLALALVS
jgi:hypothetical protein